MVHRAGGDRAEPAAGEVPPASAVPVRAKAGPPAGVGSAVTVAAFAAAGAAAVLLAAPLDRYRRWSTAGAPGQELLFSLLLGGLLLAAAGGYLLARRAHRRRPLPQTAVALVVGPGHLALLASMLAVAWFGALPAPRGERLLAAAWLAARLLLAGGAVASALAERRSPAQPARPRFLAPALLGIACALPLAAGISGLPATLGWLLGAGGLLALSVHVVALVAVLLPGPRASPASLRDDPRWAGTVAVGMIADVALALARGAHDDYFTLSQAAALAALGWSVVGGLRDTSDARERGSSAPARARQPVVHLPGGPSAGRDTSEAWAQELLRNLLKAVEAMRIGLTVSSPEGKIVYVNPADAELHGWDRDALLGQPVSVYATSARPRGGIGSDPRPQPWFRDRENVTRDGERFPVRLHSDVVRDDAGEVVAVVTLCENISDELRVKAALQRRERVLEVLESATEHFLRGGLQPDHEVDVLAGLCRAAEVENAQLTRLAPPRAATADARSRSAPLPAAEAQPAPEEPLQAALRRLGRQLPPGEPWVGATRDLPADVAEPLAAAGVGSLACVPASIAGENWALLSLSTREVEREWSPIEVEALAIAARILAAAEESERARAALHASEAGYRAVVESASDLIQSVDGEGRFGFVNEAWAAAVGWSRQEVAGLTIWDVLEPGEHAAWRQVLDGVMAGEARSDTVSTFRTRSGDRLRVEGNVTPHLEGGRPVAALAILSNVSERDRLARMKDEFVATVSHELRTPLTSMLGALSLLRGSRLDGEPDRRRELTEVAVRNGERLLRLVNELLDIQKLEAGQLRVHLVEADTRDLLEEAGKGVEALAESKGVQLHLASEPGLRVRCDRERLVQVLFNVLSNAIKFSPAGEQVQAQARPSGESVEIEVADRGPGIARDFRRRLFEPFTQADSSSVRSAGGSGLGLFISRRLVEAMGGSIRLEEREGGGTRAVVTVPRESAVGTTV